jgi:hypothetical protein
MFKSVKKERPKTVLGGCKKYSLPKKVFPHNTTFLGASKKYIGQPKEKLKF